MLGYIREPETAEGASEMSRRIYPYGGHPPIPGEADKTKTANGSRGRMRLRVKKRARKQKRLEAKRG